MYDPQKPIAFATSEIGYKEQPTNRTKFAAALDQIKGLFNGRKQGVAWCAVFVVYCLWAAFGLDVARKLLNLPNNSSAAGVRWVREYLRRVGCVFKDGERTPQIGDLIFFAMKSSSDSNARSHIGFVTGINTRYVYTIEGNASNMVRRKSYLRTDPYIADYGRPRYDKDFGPSAPVVSPVPLPATSMPTLRKGSSGEAVRTLQTALNRSGAALVLDGIFGPKTQAEVKKFQKARGITADGVVGAATWALLKAVG